jgi:hypothetical protein
LSGEEITVRHKEVTPRGVDAIERGETVMITRGSHVVPKIGHAWRRTVADLRSALEHVPAPDERFAGGIAAVLAHVSAEGTDPWAGA